MPDSTVTTGRLGEDLAAQHLRRQGYTIICRNFRRRCGEIDIIAAKGQVTYFVEVKARRRSGQVRPADNVTPHKRRQIARTAALWFAEQGRETSSALLVAEVYLDSGQIVLFEDLLC